MPVGLCSATAPSRSAARGAPVKGDGIVCSVRGPRRDRQIGQTPRGEKMGTPRRSSLPEGAPAPSDAGHCITHQDRPKVCRGDGMSPSEADLNPQLSTLTSQPLQGTRTRQKRTRASGSGVTVTRTGLPAP